MAKKPATKKTKARKPCKPALPIYNLTIAPSLEPEDWWVDRVEVSRSNDPAYRARKQPDGKRPRKGVFWSGPFTESKALSEADRLNEQFRPPEVYTVAPPPVPEWSWNNFAWTMAVCVVVAAVTSGIWYIFTT